MGYLPLFLEVTGKSCLVLGGGAVAERKIMALLKAQATVTVISPSLTPRLRALASDHALHHLARRYEPGDLRGHLLVYAALSDSAVARMAAEEARALGIPINIADMNELCTFIAPAVAQRGRLQIAISTGGASPGLAKLLREEFEAGHGPEYGLLVEILGAARDYLRRCEPAAGKRRCVNQALAASALHDCLKRRDFDAADRLLMSAMGAGLTQLGFDRARLVSCPAELAATVAAVTR
ncbi:MAG: precorrin-2 dehydrogenase/sirohydrochlorin ferrochelatase family protein [Candidatus Binataceae bacterium]